MANEGAIRATDLMRIKPFRLLWGNTFLFILVQSTSRFALVWLALDLGARSNISGLILFVMGIPALLISLPVGAMSDRLDRRRILLVSQVGALVTALVTAVMVSNGTISIPWTVALAGVSGIFIALGTPVRGAIVPTLVDRDRLVGAVAVSTIGSNLALIIGPAAAGPTIRQWGIQGAFWLQVVLYALGLLLLLPLDLPSRDVPERKQLRDELLGGIRFVAGHEAVRSFFILLSCSVLFMMSPWIVLGPQIAREEVGATGEQTTLLFAMLGVGQFAMSMVIMRWNHVLKRKGLWFMCGLCWGSAVQMLLGQAFSLVTMGLFLFMWGLGGGLYTNLNQTLIQNNTPPAVMGRVMALQSLLMSGLAPAGALLVGFVARSTDNVPATFTACGALMLLSVVYFLAFHRHLRPLS